PGGGGRGVVLVHGKFQTTGRAGRVRGWRNEIGYAIGHVSGGAIIERPIRGEIRNAIARAPKQVPISGAIAFEIVGEHKHPRWADAQSSNAAGHSARRITHTDRIAAGIDWLDVVNRIV